jgi:hypothetical protein
MSTLQPAPDGHGIGNVHLATALAALAVPIISAAFLIAGPAFLEPGTYMHLVMPAAFGANLANLILFVGVSKAHWGPDRFRDLLSISAIFSGICASAVAVLAGMFSTLGG